PPVAAGSSAVAADAWRPAPSGAGPRANHARRTVAPGDFRGNARRPSRRHSRPKEEGAMNVALWAEIRRLAEIDKLSGRVIARRLHCSRHTVAAALAQPQPPSSQVARHASLLDPYVDQIKDLLAKYPDLSAV